MINKNDDVFKTIADVTHNLPLIDEIPKKISNEIQLVLDINPNHNQIQNVVANLNTGGILYSTPSDPDIQFYLTSVSMSGTVSAGGVIAGDSVICVLPDGTNGYFTNIANASTTEATCNALNLTFSGKGILLKKGTNVVYNQDINMSGGSATIVGYTQDKKIYSVNP